MALIVEDEIGDVPPEVANAEEVILMIQHFEADTLANAAATSNDGWFDLDPNGEVGNSFRLVNGKYNPRNRRYRRRKNRENHQHL